MAEKMEAWKVGPIVENPSTIVQFSLYFLEFHSLEVFSYWTDAVNLLTNINHTVVSRDGNSITDEIYFEMTVIYTPTYDIGNSGG